MSNVQKINSSIGIINYGIGNINSIVNMINYLGSEIEIISSKENVKNYDKLILPGIGNFDSAAIALRQNGFSEELKNLVNKGKIILGICVGMQLLFEGSEEGKEPGLGILKGYFKHLNNLDENLIIPHMGWNSVVNSNNSSLLKDKNEEGLRFYFAHSYFLEEAEPEICSGYCTYGQNFTCAVEKGNIYGAQFHPEKSHKYGMNFFKNFIEL